MRKVEKGYPYKFIDSAQWQPDTAAHDSGAVIDNDASVPNLVV